MTIVILASAATAYAGMVGFDARLTGGYGNGGAFNVELAAEENAVPSCLRFGDVGGNKTTFCVESVTFTTNVWYEASVDSTILNGGQNAVLNLTSTTRNLFAQYAMGSLDTHVGTNTDRNRALQWIFWNEQAPDLVFTLTTNQTDERDYILANYNTDNGWASHVKVLNLWTQPTTYTGDKQSHLVVCIPAPAAALLGLLGLGAAGWVKRRIQ